MKARSLGIEWGLALVVLAAAAVMANGCLTEQNPINKKIKPAPLPAGSLGTQENPVKAADDLAEKDYLMRLRGPDGKKVKFESLGSVTLKPQGTLLDRYIIQSQDGTVCCEVYMVQKYPGYVETKPIAGFTLEKAK